MSAGSVRCGNLFYVAGWTMDGRSLFTGWRIGNGVGDNAVSRDTWSNPMWTVCQT